MCKDEVSTLKVILMESVVVIVVLFSQASACEISLPRFPRIKGLGSHVMVIARRCLFLVVS